MMRPQQDQQTAHFRNERSATVDYGHMQHAQTPGPVTEYKTDDEHAINEQSIHVSMSPQPKIHNQASMDYLNNGDNSTTVGGDATAKDSARISNGSYPKYHKSAKKTQVMGKRESMD